MKQWFLEQSPVLQALIAGCFTWSVTALGAALVFFARSMSRKVLDGMLGFSGGVMLAASYFSLLAPAEAAAQDATLPPWAILTIGFLLGGAALFVLDRTLPHLHLFGEAGEEEGLPTTWHRSILLVLAITLHNIPEGLAVGVGFGSSGLGGAGVGAAVALAIGIGVQNFPEGAAVSLPLRGEGTSRRRSFLFGQASGVVEPLAAVGGAALVGMVAPLLPYALAFAAGAMVYVVVEELIPETQRAGHVDLAAIWLMVGFALMMTLDLALG